ncbi:MAG: DUF1549 domain-containing protein [Planctomycetota bacterium]
MSFPTRSLCVGITTLLMLASFRVSVAQQEKLTQKQLDFFEKKIRPVLVDKCYSCHSKDSKSVKGGLILDSRDAIRAGGESGHAVVPGEIENSLLIEAIRYDSFEMPPKEQLPESVISDFEKWVRMGAPDPREGPTLVKREIDFEEGKKHWSFQPLKISDAPSVKNQSWPRSDIDRYVLAKLESSSLKPVPDADRRTLARRLYFDLIGLPPTPEQLQTFLDDESPSAVEDLVDQLLDSPQFGERWGRHWLDVVRYAESNGRERNFVYPNAWRYRDYVIAAFNSNKPFDTFIREQIAGDLAEDPTNEQLIATGFLAIGPKLLNEGNKNAFKMDLVDEQIDVTTRAFMGLTVSCARCHDHKFDPIPTAEYYSMAGIFRSTDTLYGTQRQQGNRQSSPLVELKTDQDKLKNLRQQKQKRLDDIDGQIAANKKRISDQQKQSKSLSSRKNKDKSKQVDKKAVANLRQAINKSRNRIKQLTQQRKQVEQQQPSELAMGVRDGKVSDSPVYIRGEVSSPKGTAPRGLLTILDPELQQPVLTTEQSGRRELAEWIVDTENPMTSRVIVNRIWRHIFGVGLVRTVDNFGTTGEMPSHPVLLDHLADEFMNDGWSVKSMIKKLVMSRTYQLSSNHHAENYEADPDNRMYWRHSPKRIDAEALRDAILVASGKLNVSPPSGSPVSALKGEYGRQVKVGQLIKDHRHRSVYLPIIRNDVPEALKLFDFAEPSILVGDRPVTTVPTQALFFLNSEFVTEQSDALVANLLIEQDGPTDDIGRVSVAYQSVLSRKPTLDEIERATNFIERMQDELVQQRDDISEEVATEHAWSGFVQALFGTAEFRYVD